MIAILYALLALSGAAFVIGLTGILINLWRYNSTQTAEDLLAHELARHRASMTEWADATFAVSAETWPAE